MIYQFIIGISIAGLSWIFWRRWVLTRRGLKFEQELLKQEERKIEQEEEQNESPILNESISDLQVERQAEKRANEEKTRKIREAKRAYKQADLHFTKGEHELAEKHLLQALAFDGDHLDSNLKLGILYLNQENLTRAEFFFQKLIDLKEHPTHYAYLALTLDQQDRVAEAAQLYEKAIEIDSKDPKRYLSLAQVYQKLGEIEKALKSFEQASRLEPRNLDYLWILVDYYEKLARQESLLETLKRILALDPYNLEAKEKWELAMESAKQEQFANSQLEKDE